MKTYQLELTETQIEVVAKALDLFARIGIGQIEQVMECHHHRPQFLRNRESAERCLQEAKFLLTGFLPNASFGITSSEVPDTYRVAFDMSNVIKHSLAWERNTKVTGVYAEKPLQWGQEPLITLQIKK